MNQSNLKRLFLPVASMFLLLSIMGGTSSAAPFAVVGTVREVSGRATVVRQDRTIPAKIGLEICENDMLRTDPDGSIGVLFNDDTRLSLGPESVLVIDEFVFAPEQEKFSIVIRMMKGTAAYLSGLISKLAPDAAHFETPSASIGIRGTKFLVKVKDK